MKAKILAALMVFAMAFGGMATAEEVKPLPDASAATNQMNAAPPVLDIKEGGRVERNYRQQPPMIPHKVDKYEIDLKVNQCLRCHDWPNNVQENAPMVSATHYLDRNGNKLDKVSSNRWFCVQCHVPQANAKPLVENNFHSAADK